MNAPVKKPCQTVPGIPNGENTMKTLQIDTSDSILIDGRYIGLKVTQRREGTVVYTPESIISGRKYQEHKMPHARYSTAHDSPDSGAAGRIQFESDIRGLIME